MNEATFEARVNKELMKIFPCLQQVEIEHQKTFTLKFGHHKIKVNSEENEKKYGRLDLLIKYKTNNFAVLELKRPGKVITNDDCDQGISYARLITPMPPLVIVSNGKDTYFYKTIDKSKLQIKTIDEDAIEELFKHAFLCAESSMDASIKFLLGKEKSLWKEIVNNYTNDAIDRLKGTITDFTMPITDEFNLKRDIVKQIFKLLKKEKLIVLEGEPLSGKTNVLYQLYKNKDKNHIIPLYIDASITSQGILKRIANIFSNNLFYNINPDEVRQWMRIGLTSISDRLVIMIDGLSKDSNDRIKEDLEELIELSNNYNLSIVIAIDKFNLEKFEKTNGRITQNGILGRASKLYLSSLDENEFKDAKKYVHNKFNTTFFKGVDFNNEYRNPRILRIIASKIEKSIRELNIDLNTNERIGYNLSSVTTDKMLNYIWEIYMSDPNIRMNFRYLVKAHIEDNHRNINDMNSRLICFGQGLINYEIAEDVAGSERIKALINYGYVQLVNGPNSITYVRIKLPELLSTAAANYIADEMAVMINNNDIENAYKFLVEKSEPFPYGDIVGAEAVYKLGERIGHIPSELFINLLGDYPYKEISKDKIKCIIRKSDTEVEKIEDEESICNIHPWLILSQLSCNNISNISTNEYSNISILGNVASYKDFLRRDDISSLYENSKEFYFYKVKEGRILSREAGVVEPITFGLINGFDLLGEEMLKLSEIAVKESDYFLAYRLHIAAEHSLNHLDKNVRKIASQIIDELKTLVSEVNSCEKYR